MPKKQDQYSLKTLQKLYTKLINLQPYSNPSTNIQIPQILNEMGKIIVWGEREHNSQQNGDIFDFICEVKLFDLLLEIFTKCKNVQTINSIIGFYNMLLTNINRQQTLLYLLSHPCILSMVLTKFGTMANELAEYYINFLKGLSRKIDINTIHIFFNKRYPNFPLLFQTIRFFNHPQNLVRTTCRNIILSVFKFCSQRKQHQSKTQSIQSSQNPKNTGVQSQSDLLFKKLTCIHDYLTSFPFCIYYIHESNFIREYWKILDMILEPEGGQESIYENQHYEIENLDQIISDHEELLIFLDDLLENDQSNQKTLLPRNSSELNFEDMFISAFSNQCLSELVMSLCSIKKAFLGIKTSLLVFIFLLSNIHNKLLCNTIIFSLFSIYYPKTITHKLLNPTQNLLSYNKEWKFKGFWDGHQDKLNQHCAKNYYLDKVLKSDIAKGNEENQKKKAIMGQKSQSIFGVQSNYYEREVEKLQKIFGVNILKKTFQQNTNYPQSSKSINKSFAQSFKTFLSELPQINSGNINLNQFDQNPVAANIYAFLESKDDTLIMLSLNLLQKVFSIKSIDPELLHFCKLSTKPKSKDFASIITIQRIVLNCLKIFQIDPPNLRICTYKQAAKVFMHFVKLYENEEIEFPKELIFEAKKGLKTSISRITPYLYGGKEWSKVVEIYLVILRENNKFRKNTLRTYGLIPDEMASSNPKAAKPKFTDELYDTTPRTFEQQIGRDLWIYIILKDLLTEISKSPLISRHFSLKIDLIPSKQNKGSKYEEGKSYNLQKDDHFKALFKQIKEEKYQECDVILLGGYLVIGAENKVEYKLPHQDTYLIPDKSDPRKVLVQSGNLTVSLQFDNLKQTLSMKENFMQSKNLLLKCHLSSIIKEIQSIQNQIK